MRTSVSGQPATVIDIQGAERDRVLRSRVSKLVGKALATLAVEPVKARVTFLDDNGPKAGRIMRMVAKGRLDPDTSSKFRQLLRDARGQLLRRVSVTNDEMQGLTGHASGAFDEDSASAVTADLLERIGGHERHELDEIRAAQARLETGSFGVCEMCGLAIHLSRLRAVPWTRHCFACQSQEEGHP